MAILGVLIDKQSVSRAGDALGSAGGGVTFSTLPHSLPNTTPDMFLPILKSVQGLGIGGVPELLAFGANQSILTLGFAAPSSASCPTLFYDIFAQVFWAPIR